MSVYRYINNLNTPVITGSRIVKEYDQIISNHRIKELEGIGLVFLIDGVEQPYQKDTKEIVAPVQVEEKPVQKPK